jgi:hypothetical protein
MLIIYNYILKLHHVENGEYWIIHIFSRTCTSLDNFKNRIYIYNLFECMLDMWLINLIVLKLNNILMLIIKLKNISTFNTFKRVYGYLFFCVTRSMNCLLYIVGTLIHDHYELKYMNISMNLQICAHLLMHGIFLFL